MRTGKKCVQYNVVALAAIVAWIVVLLSFLYIVKLRSQDVANASPVGTFITGSRAEQEYFVFDQEGRYYQYRQRQPMQSGTYEHVGTLISLYGDKSSQVVFSEGLLYVYQESKGRFTVYEKTANVPTFVDVTFGDEGSAYEPPQ